ncbi:TerD family protein [Rhodococcus sp. NPDC057135]|uniref:TerD family protein n=1 Tax=Rhodococcus sp. NPDC057135 TaxID=3346028 RepID=UPI00362D97D5
MDVPHHRRPRQRQMPRKFLRSNMDQTQTVARSAELTVPGRQSRSPATSFGEPHSASAGAKHRVTHAHPKHHYPRPNHATTAPGENMTSLTRGQNTPLNSPQLTVNVTGVTPGTVDLMVFQVTSTGKVRNDNDFVFFNQPASPEGAVRLTGSSTVTIDVTRIPPSIDTLRFAVSMDDSAPGSLAGIRGLSATLGEVAASAPHWARSRPQRHTGRGRGTSTRLDYRTRRDPGRNLSER